MFFDKQHNCLQQMNAYKNNYAIPFGFNTPMTDPIFVFHKSVCERPNKNNEMVIIEGFKSLIFHILKVVPEQTNKNN